MSGTMARQGGRVQLEQSDMRLALNIVKIATGGFQRTVMEETQQLIDKPPTEVQEEKKRGVEVSGHKKLKAAIARHPAMIRKIQTKGFLPCENGTAMDPQPHWRTKGTSASSPWLAPCRSGMLPPQPGDSGRSEFSETAGVPPGYLYIHTSISSAEFFNPDSYGKDSKRNKDFIPDLLTDEGPSTG